MVVQFVEPPLCSPPGCLWPKGPPTSTRHTIVPYRPMQLVTDLMKTAKLALNVLCSWEHVSGRTVLRISDTVSACIQAFHQALHVGVFLGSVSYQENGTSQRRRNIQLTLHINATHTAQQRQWLSQWQTLKPEGHKITRMQRESLSFSSRTLGSASPNIQIRICKVATVGTILLRNNAELHASNHTRMYAGNSSVQSMNHVPTWQQQLADPRFTLTPATQARVGNARCDAVSLVHQYEEHPPQVTAIRAAYDCWTQYPCCKQHTAQPKTIGHRLSGSGSCTDRYSPTQRGRIDRYSDQNKWSSRIEPAFMKDFPDLRATTKFVAIRSSIWMATPQSMYHDCMTAHVVS